MIFVQYVMTRFLIVLLKKLLGVLMDAVEISMLNVFKNGFIHKMQMESLGHVHYVEFKWMIQTLRSLRIKKNSTNFINNNFCKNKINQMKRQAIIIICFIPMIRVHHQMLQNISNHLRNETKIRIIIATTIIISIILIITPVLIIIVIIAAITMITTIII